MVYLSRILMECAEIRFTVTTMYGGSGHIVCWVCWCAGVCVCLYRVCEGLM